MNRDDAGEARKPHEETKCAMYVPNVAEHDQSHLADLTVRDHHGEVYGRECEKCAQTEKVDAARSLPATKEPNVPGKPCRERGRHGEAGRDGKRRQ